MFKRKFTILCLFCSQTFSAGFKLPEQSSDATALSVSNIATSFGADSAYYNPANMSFLPFSHYITLSNQYIHAGVQKFINKSKNFIGKNYNTKSRDGNFYMPSFHFVSPFFGDRFRLGVSLTSPAGISTRWDDPYPRSIAELFQIKIAELGASISAKITDNLSISAGIRGLYAKAHQKNKIKDYEILKGISISTKRELRGDAKGLGYTLAMTYKPTENLSFASVYKSKIKMDFKSDSDGVYIDESIKVLNKEILNKKFIGSGGIKTYLPASLTLGASYKFDDLTFLFAYDRTFWSVVKDMDFYYSNKVPLNFIYDKPIKRNWSDTDTYRFGIAYDYSDKLRFMGGFAYDKSTSDYTLTTFELPDTRSYIYSGGINYNIDENLGVGLSYLYQHRLSRDVNHQDKIISFNNVVGKFDKNYISILNLSINYRF